MQLKTLILEDFLSYQSETIDLPSGLVAVVGHNHDSMGAGSNGGGKSALFDAVSWVLYGETLRGIKTDEVIRIGAKSCEVALSFESEGEVYFVQRKRSRSSELIFMRGQQDLSQSTIALTQEKIDQTLGMDFRMFKTVATFSGDALRFANATDKEQKEILEKLMGMEDYSNALERVRKELNVLLPGINFREKQVAQERGLLVIRRDEITKLQEARNDAANKADEAIATIKMKGNHCNEGMARNDAEIRNNNYLRSQLEAQLAGATPTDDSPYRAMSEAQATYRSSMQRVEEIKRTIARLSQELQGTQQQVGRPCPSCARPLTVNELTALMEAQAQKVCEQVDALALVEATLKDQELRVNTLNAKAAEAQKLITEANAKRNGVVTEMQKYTRLNQELEAKNRELLAALEAHKRSKVEIEGTVNTYDARIADATKRLTEAEASITKGDAELATDRDRAEYLKFWEKGFGMSGIRSMLLDGVADKLTERTNHYLKILSGGTQWTEFSTQSATKDGDAREKFAVKVFNQHGAATYQGNSAGERKRVDIAVALALHYLARNRASRALGFAILDEIFECLDEVGCDNVVNLLRGEHEQLGTIFVVSHNPAMGARFASTIEIAKKDGVSRVMRQAKEPVCVESKPASTETKKAKSPQRSRKTTPASKKTSQQTV